MPLTTSTSSTVDTSKRRTPHKHRHDGTSPLPLGMDWSPPPKKWEGRDTVWPHDHRTGWSYCVTVPSWMVQPESRVSDAGFSNPIVFYRVQIGMQSPEGISTICGIYRRFSDFLNLYSALKRAFPKKIIPSPPPRHRFSRISSSHLLLEERRHALEEWMGRLLSDIDLSRSVSVASFLELEATARSSFQDVNQNMLEPNSSSDAMASLQFTPNSSVSVAGSLSVGSQTRSVLSDNGSDNAYETSEIGTLGKGKGSSSEVDTVAIISAEGFAAPAGKIMKNSVSHKENGVVVGDPCLGLSVHIGKANNIPGDSLYGNSSKYAHPTGNNMDFSFEEEHDKLSSHAHGLSIDSVGSDASSLRGSELSNAIFSNSLGDNFICFATGAEGTPIESLSSEVLQSPNDVQVFLPLDQQDRLNRMLTTVQRRIATTKTDMEDMIARLNQEIAVKDYLTTKVKDLNVELESSKQKSKENLQQAMLVERERVTLMQWDMDELRRKYSEMEAKFKLEQDEKVCAESKILSAAGEKELLLQELDVSREQLKILRTRLKDLEVKSKADKKVLVKEIKFLRSSQADLKEVLNQSLKEKSELELAIQKQKQNLEYLKSSKKKFLHECGILHLRLQECSSDFLMEEEDKFICNPSSSSDALDLLTTSDNRIGLLIAEAQLLTQDDENAPPPPPLGSGNEGAINDLEVRKMLTEVLIENARLRKHVNSMIRCAMTTVAKSEKEEVDETRSRQTVLNKFLER
ncbi:hypothetical protein QJS04_geneDACA001537 [Acorus gramineus]|uniref:PX domain-containing protein n=1 Tax=Acorus gramineus TaxID=55184 RepID=A0AAV9BJ50_ACOGR|nr:hypothetical protein QJS04_geneDACA001537 [Acorus gramineus]